MGMRAPLVQMGWHPPGLSVPLPPLSSPAPQKSRRFSWSVSSGIGLPGSSRTKALKRLSVCVCVCVCERYASILQAVHGRRRIGH